VDVLRRGVTDLGVTIRLVYFRPAHGLTPDLVRRYGENRLTISRQLAYEASSSKAVDLALFVNGLDRFHGLEAGRQDEFRDALAGSSGPTHSCRRS
jgi:hypothetical protein